MGAVAGAWLPRGGDGAEPTRRLLAALRWRGTAGEAVRAFPGGALGAAWNGPSGGLGVDPSGRWLVAADGTPTNLRPLRDELRARGRLGDGEPTAAEVAAAVIAELGFERGLTRLEGELVIVAVDRDGPRVHLAAGRSGLQRLYRASIPGGGVAWASSPAALVRLEGVSRAVEPRLAPVALRLGFLPAPLTPWRAVAALPAGTRLALDAGGETHTRASGPTPNPPGAGGSAARWARSIRYAVELAVLQRIDAGCALVGGQGAAGAILAAVAGRRGLSPLGAPDDPTPQVALELLDEVGRTTGEPLFASGALRDAARARTAWEAGAEVLLVDTGADAVFAAPVAGKLRRAWGRLAPEGLRRARGWEPRAVVARAPLPDADDGGAWVEVDALAARAPGADDGRETWLRRSLLLPDRDLGPAAAAAAAFGTELRAPFGDPRLVALVGEVPIELLRAGGDPLALLHAAFPEHRGLAPPRPLPVGAWLRGPLRSELDRLPEAAAPFVEPDAPRRWIALLNAGDDALAEPLWRLFALARWHARAG